MKQDDVKREEMKDMESMERELAAYEELRKEIENEIYMLPREKTPRSFFGTYDAPCSK